ncbi:hypothetical protein GLOIN_2v1875132 [Rhizophagus clarus]|uniref:Uncharacterized protein n=1 Tax=Rhizophagus clarus TaxID=94130 RepID=A0A8H3LLX8_9GLOM|nr:hypothetical protein GLOIN_2v1875132 [Rhizophagus clarus]
MSNFLNHINYNDLCSLLNINEQVQKLANKARDGKISQKLTGKELLKFCLLDTNQFDLVDIDSATDEIWNSRLTDKQKKLFTSLAENVNKTRYANTIKLIVQINMPQKTKMAFEDSFYNETSLVDILIIISRHLLIRRCLLMIIRISTYVIR